MTDTDVQMSKPYEFEPQFAQPAESHTQETQESWKPSKPMLYVFCAILVALGIMDNIGFDYAFGASKDAFLGPMQPTKMHIGIIFLWDAFARIIISLPFVISSGGYRNIMKLQVWDVTKVFLCRCALQLGFLMGVMAIDGIGSGAKAVFIQTQVAFVCFFRYILIGDKPTWQQGFHAVIIAVLACGFKVHSFGDDSNKNNSQFMIGLVFIMISVFVVSLMFTVMEIILKKTLSNVQGWDKQILFATADVPAQIAVLFVAATLMIYYEEKKMTYNFFENMDALTGIMATVCTFYGLLIWAMFDWTDAMYVNLLFVLITAFTWPMELLLKVGGESFSAYRLLILIGLIISCVAYNAESKLESKRSKEIEELKKQAEHRAIL